MGLRAIYRRPRTSRPAPGVRVYPYLLGKAEITRPNQVWAADITYLPIFLYLVAVMDWHSRYVLSWRLSNTLEAVFCAEALTEALESGRPEVFNTDQGSQFTSQEFTQHSKSLWSFQRTAAALCWPSKSLILPSSILPKMAEVRVSSESGEITRTPYRR